eukprot:6213500-Pleurochrysis_carterae.AAC.1
MTLSPLVVRSFDSESSDQKACARVGGSLEVMRRFVHTWMWESVESWVRASVHAYVNACEWWYMPT